MRAYCIRDVDWWGPAEVPRHLRKWQAWRGLDIPGPRPSAVTVSRFTPTVDAGDYVLRTGPNKGKRLGALSVRTLRSIARRRPLTRAALVDFQAARVLLHALRRVSDGGP